MRRGNTPLRFGVWAPHHGYFGSDQHPLEPPDASYGHNREVIVTAEQLGFDATLLAQQTISTRSRDADVIEPWTTAAAIAEATSQIEIIAAIKPYLYNPGLLAKQAINIDHISRGRFAINLVSGWFVPEMEKLGLPALDHDRRYAYTEEWISVVRGLLAGDTVTQTGEFVSVRDLILRPRPINARGPTVYFGGESEAARRLGALQADVFFINGRALEETKALIDDMSARPRSGRPLRYALSAFVIARETEREARDEFDYLLRLSQLTDGGHLKAGTDKAVQMMKVNAGIPVVGSNGGTNAGLVGSYDQVADRIRQFADLGIELFMLQFQPLIPELTRFAEQIFPRVRTATKERNLRETE
jgi:alkanesulfonate monooxygenase